MNIANAIIHIFPNSDPSKDFEVRDDSDGNGPYVAVWNIDAPQPTEEELLVAYAAWEAEEAAKSVPKTPEQSRLDQLENEIALRDSKISQLSQDSADTTTLLLELYETIMGGA